MMTKKPKVIRPKTFNGGLDLYAEAFNDRASDKFIDERVIEMLEEIRAAYIAVDDIDEEGGIFYGPTRATIPAVRITFNVTGKKRRKKAAKKQTP
jgi:hypothetical protein